MIILIYFRDIYNLPKKNQNYLKQKAIKTETHIYGFGNRLPNPLKSWDKKRRSVSCRSPQS